MSKINNKILVVVERDNFIKDSQLLKSLEPLLHSNFKKIVYAHTSNVYVSKLLDHYVFNSNCGFIRKILKAITLLFFPKFWSYYLRSTEPSFTEKINKVIDVVKAQQEPVVLLGRSSGARIATLCADELGVSGVICLGYPFRHPDMGDEPERYMHLRNIKTPTLIVQGTRDVYGGFGEYDLSSKIHTLYINTDHDFDLNDKGIIELSGLIKSFVENETI